MYTKSDRVFWHSISCPITWCFAIWKAMKNCARKWRQKLWIFLCVAKLSVWKDVMWFIDAGSWEGESSWEGTTKTSQRLWVAIFVANVSILGFDRYLSKSSLLHICFLLPGLRASRLTWDQPFCLEHSLPIVSLTWTSPRVPSYRVLSGTTSSTSSGFSSMSSACFSPCITCTSFTKTSAALTSRPSGWPA